MKKIEQEMLKAIECGKPWKNRNTTLAIGHKHISIHLHGNLLAIRRKGEGKDWVAVRKTVSKWPTRTTFSRLRALGIDTNQLKKELDL